MYTIEFYVNPYNHSDLEDYIEDKELIFEKKDDDIFTFLSDSIIQMHNLLIDWKRDDLLNEVKTI